VREEIILPSSFYSSGVGGGELFLLRRDDGLSRQREWQQPRGGENAGSNGALASL
jgi:hypothetical protein